MTTEPDTTTDLAGLLDWYVAAGADEAIGDAAVDRFALSAAAKPAPVAVTEKPVSRTPVSRTRPAGASAAVAPEAGAAMAREAASAATTLDELKSAIEAFEGCSLKATAMNTVFADGSPDADIMIVGEAPGADEDRQGIPFVGVSGQLMDRIFAAAGYTREAGLYITNMLPWRPPGNRKPSPQEITMLMPFIRRHIELVSPTILVLAGGTAAASLLDTTTGITRLRGRWHELTVSGRTIPTLPIFHPAYLLRQPASKREAWRDVLEIRARLQPQKKTT